MKQLIHKLISSIASLFLFLFGNFDFILKALLALMLIDYITGVSRAFITKKVNSSIGGKGIIKKAIYLCVIAVAVLLDNLLEVNGGLRALIIYSFIFNEMLSILENSSALGIKIPITLYQSLEKINNDSDNLKKNKNS
ncbi:MAG: phage holin family protein [Bacilli bacterium]|nr:phage holin family protein [Bacilli bacterium]